MCMMYLLRTGVIRAGLYQEFVEKTMLGDRAELAKMVLASMDPEEIAAAKEKVCLLYIARDI